MIVFGHLLLCSLRIRIAENDSIELEIDFNLIRYSIQLDSRLGISFFSGK